MEHSYTLMRRTVSSGGWRSSYEYRLDDACARTVLACGAAAGYLAAPVPLTDAAGAELFRVAPNRRVMPSSWELADAAGRVLWRIRFGVVQSADGGRFGLEDGSGAGTYEIVASDSLAREARKDLAGCSRDDLVLCRGHAPVAFTGRPVEKLGVRPRGSPLRLLPEIVAFAARTLRGDAEPVAEFRETDRVWSRPTEAITPELAFLMLLFRHHYHRHRSD